MARKEEILMRIQLILLLKIWKIRKIESKDPISSKIVEILDLEKMI